MSVLTKPEIEKLIHLDKMIIGFGSLLDQLQPNGFDLRIDKIYRYNAIGFIGNTKKDIPEYKEMDLHNYGLNEAYYLPVGTYVFDIAETIKLPLDVCAITIQRSSVMRCGCITNIGFWDSGYNGKGFSQLIVNNIYGFRISHKAKIIQMIFLKNTKQTESYKGSYQLEGVIK